jgi:subtilase family serine protease
LKSRLMTLLAIASIASLAACSGQSGSNAIPALSQNDSPSAVNTARSCATLLPGDEAACFAVYRTDIGYVGNNGGTPPGTIEPLSNSATTPSGYGPSSLQAAYKLPSSTGGTGQTVAIVDAYDDPSAEADLGVYRAQYGLAACTTANGCFRKVSQTGTTQYPASNGGWAQEESLDLDMVSASCPNCHILFVEATSATNANLATAENEAATLHATEISNSYGGGESGATNSAYSHAGIIITASAGDSGTGAQQPASYATVVAVGGTTLKTASNSRGWTETVWSGTGSGCSAYVAKPSWQTDKGCTKRSETDVSAVADPNTGVAVYDSFAYQGYQGWLVFGGTSVSSPLMAGVYALAGNAASLNAAQSIWQHGGTSALNDVTSGSNGRCSRSYTYICTAGVGYDGPTGWGTPSGVTAF